MSVDIERREVSYLLGRLFAVLEKAQLDALGKINATIPKDTEVDQVRREDAVDWIAVKAAKKGAGRGTKKKATKKKAAAKKKATKKKAAKKTTKKKSAKKKPVGKKKNVDKTDEAS